MFGSVKCQISSGKIANYPKNTPFWPRFSTFWQRFLGGLKKMKKNFEEWVCRIWYEIYFTPSPLLARLLHTAKPCNKHCAKVLHMRNVPFAYVERVKKWVQSGSRQSTGINPVRAKVGINFAPQSSFANKPICFIN